MPFVGDKQAGHVVAIGGKEVRTDVSSWRWLCSSYLQLGREGVVDLFIRAARARARTCITTDTAAAYMTA